MHIAIDARIINSSTGRYVERLLHYLEQIDTTNTYSVLVRERDKNYWKPTNPHFTVRVADFANYSFSEQVGFKRYLDALNPDLVHFTMPQQPVRYRGLHVTTFHDLILLNTYNSDKNWAVFHAKQLVGRAVFKRVARRSKRILVPTKFVHDELLKFVTLPKRKVVVTYEASDTALARPVPHKTNFKKYLLYVGQQSDYKNIRRLAQAHQQLLRSHPDLGLVLVGKLDKAAAANKALFIKSGYRNVEFTGFVDNHELAWLYKNAAAYVFPSLMEGFGLPGLEAMGAGTPVVSSNATCLPEVYGRAAHYFNPKSVDDMAHAIQDVLDKPDVRRRLITNGYLQVKKYSWHRMAQQTHAVYLDALKKRA